MKNKQSEIENIDLIIDAISIREEKLMPLVGLDPRKPPPPTSNKLRKTLLHLAAAEWLIDATLRTEQLETLLENNNIEKDNLFERLRVAENVIDDSGLSNNYFNVLAMIFPKPRRLFRAYHARPSDGGRD